MKKAGAQISEAENETAERDRETLRQMLLIRRFEEKCVELYSAGKIHGFLHLYIGEEAVAVGIMPLLKAEDRIVATYREHGHALARGISPGAIMAEMFGKSNGCSKGRGGSMHLFDAEKRFYGGNAIVGGGMPLAVGLALADKMRRNPFVTVCFFGEGAAAEGEFHESMNLAALWKLPVLFVCENNLYAMGTALSRSHSQTDITRKADAYGMKSAAVDGMKVTEVREAAGQAIDFVRENSEPFLLEARTYRFRAHSMYDPELYRSKDEVEEWKDRCPIDSFKSELLNRNEISDIDVARMEKEIESEVKEAVDFAEAGEWEPLGDLLKDVYTPVEA
ncbi:MAG: pyruvate dehydrogenase (acetyl-transferring) E1 component subunit alpha [Pyrinomonadaceae bacterium]|nr:pyruvate dehydrogenase (acetyl-transferring) E1 component subunit alpha [Pyrinomonadaceae bacterium]